MGFFSPRPTGRPVTDSLDDDLEIPSFLRRPVAPDERLGLSGELVERDIAAAAMEAAPKQQTWPAPVPLPEKHAEIIGRYIEHLEADAERLRTEITSRERELAETELTLSVYRASLEIIRGAGPSAKVDGLEDGK